MAPQLPRQYRITYDMLQRAKKKLTGKGLHPCTPEIRKACNALQAANYRMAAAYKYVKDMDDCLNFHKQQLKTKSKPSTLFYLSQYVDKGKGYKNKTWGK
mmetsp:Transcript_22107/g.28602  ORF Transcript_22107/g.28602 Transcript_22107/m.28602 type:complete len:100 (+) Transcript_22107:162-461(+)|eukprot:CAMPEP_0198147972 /NCGR_PEP_ID=MMETSP1443-20131203/38900_1 /TAXON_ID=186043 /ORGANISM="Entomoneis sp., Strain CCMP2396" /LENGTH=99 /DNA_ID=CAMNT_0043812517 /DNA_START=120 /DNA_END=419 /DNA_ORIENTATION=+